MMPGEQVPRPLGKVVLFANTDWYLWNFRRTLAVAAARAGYEVLLVSPPGEYGPRFAGLGLRWQAFGMDRRSLNPLREARVLWRLYRLLRRERPALIHNFTVKCAVYGSVAAVLARVPARINAVAGMGYVFSSRHLVARALRPIVRRLVRIGSGGAHARVILQNPDDAVLFERTRMCAPSRIRLIRSSGVDCTRFAPAPAAPARRPLRVLLAARLLWQKGIGEYAAAAATLHAEALDAVFLLAGAPDPGNPSSVPDASIRRWVDAGALEWLGHVDDMAALFRSVDVVVLPSYYGEGVPKSLIEAAACGLPLVTCDAPGCREIVSDGVTGCLVPPRNPDALAGAIRRLLQDDALRRRLGDAARARAAAEFDERGVIARTLDVYAELLRGGERTEDVPPRGIRKQGGDATHGDGRDDA